MHRSLAVLAASLVACSPSQGAGRQDLPPAAESTTPSVAHPPEHGDRVHRGGHAHRAGELSPSDNAILSLQLEQVRAATERYLSVEAAVADGYVRFGRRDAPLMGEHWYRRDLVDLPLDLERPSTLQYAVLGGERRLVGVAYTTYQRPGTALPEGFAGELDRWHVHDIPRLVAAITEGRPFLRRAAQRRERRGGAPWQDGRSHLVMLHAWVWLENPDGVFALHHRGLPYLRAGLPADWTRSGDLAAAEGIALLSGDGCGSELRRIRLLAQPDHRQRQHLAAACGIAARLVASAVRTHGDDPITVNTTATAAWHRYAEVRDAVLDHRQKARIAAVIEH